MQTYTIVTRFTKKKPSEAFPKQDKICAQRVEYSRLLDFSGNFTGTAQNEQQCLRMTCISSFDYDLYRESRPERRTLQFDSCNTCINTPLFFPYLDFEEHCLLYCTAKFR